MNQSFLQGYDITRNDYVEANQMGTVHPDQEAVLTHPLTNFIGLLQPGRRSSLKLFILIPFLVIFGVFALFALDIPTNYKLGAGLILLAAFVVAIIYGAWRVFRIFGNKPKKRELERGEIRDATGQVVYGRRGYEIKLPDRRLELPFSGLGALSPGIEYRFYYLPESNTVLSAEPLSTMGMDRAEESLTEILAQANRFKLDALPQNRQGRLAMSQIVHLIPTLLIALLFVIIASVALYQILLPSISAQTWGEMRPIVIISSFIFAGLGLFAVYLLIKSILDILTGRVLSTEGQGHAFTRTSSSDSDGSSSTNYYYRIGEQRFKVTRKAHYALIEGLTYRAYYTPYRKTLVNIEALESPSEGNLTAGATWSHIQDGFELRRKQKRG
jgi:hypothetical protein